MAVMHTTYLLLGSNLGNREALLEQAIQELAGLGKITALSTVKETEPWGFEEEVPAFLNQAIRLETPLGAEELLQKCLDIEKKLGRQRPGNNTQSNLDSRMGSNTQSNLGSRMGSNTQSNLGSRMGSNTQDNSSRSTDSDLHNRKRCNSGARTYSSRLIDIDILLFDQLQYKSERLTIPHPRLKERPFAVALLQEILPKNISLQDFY